RANVDRKQGKEWMEIYFVFKNNRLVKSYQKDDLNGLEGKSWDYAYDDKGHLIYKVQTAMSPTLETYYSFAYN
ncbi:MAG: hypothetical protein JKY54_18505, partial [Flavobacteriales bacterium]|nr:hypothetical protein [Flavobacteriales bacterium]